MLLNGSANDDLRLLVLLVDLFLVDFSGLSDGSSGVGGGGGGAEGVVGGGGVPDLMENKEGGELGRDVRRKDEGEEKESGEGREEMEDERWRDLCCARGRREWRCSRGGR